MDRARQLAAMSLVGAVVCAGIFPGATMAQDVTRPLAVSVAVIDPVTQVFINQSTGSATFTFTENTVDIVAQDIFEDFEFCVTGTTAGGFQLRNDSYDTAVLGTVLPGAVSGSALMRANISIQQGVGSSIIDGIINITGQTYDYGTDCTASDPFTLAGRIIVGEQIGVTSVPADTYAAVINLTVVPV